MGRLIKPHEIDEFRDITRIPPEAITKEIIAGVRSLDERTELEPLLRSIINDPNETPHGPTEIADILTTNINIMGKTAASAFVLKGKSFSSVSGKDVSHQFMKLHTIPALGLVVFAAAGNIQDDARRDFNQVAEDIGCDYLILDANGIARLLIAYGKICPRDGLPYSSSNECPNGHKAQEATMIELPVSESTQYEIVELKDISHACAKRYSAIVVVDRHYQLDQLREIIRLVTQDVRQQTYSRNSQTQQQFGSSPADVVWLYMAYDHADIRDSNYVARTCWINPHLDLDFRPVDIGGQEKSEGIEIWWNYSYKALRDHGRKTTGTKGEVIDANRELLRQMLACVKKVESMYDSYNKGAISEGSFASEMRRIAPQVDALYFKSGNLPNPPDDCKDWDQLCQCIYASVANIFIHFSGDSKRQVDKANWEQAIVMALDTIREDLEKLKYEEKKMH